MEPIHNNVPKSVNDLSPEVVEKIENRILVILMVALIMLWGISEIILGINYKNTMKEIELRNKAFEIQHQKNLKKLKELQIKYRKDIEDEKRVSQINVFTLNYEDIEILATNNYYESRGVGRKRWKKKERDMQNITSVVLNRLDSGKYGTTIKQVIQGAKKKQNGKYVCQFSWVCDNSRPVVNKRSKEWKLAYEVAFQVYTGIVPRTVNSKALHYYNPIQSKPHWAKKAKEVAYVYGGHRIVIVD